MTLLGTTTRWKLPSTVGLTLAAGLVGGPAAGLATTVAALVLSGTFRQQLDAASAAGQPLERKSQAPERPAEAGRVDAGPSEDDVIGCATSLLQLQEAGRRIATHLDFETIVPTIVTTARSALKCRYAAVYFWNDATQSLDASLPPRPRDSGRYVPHTDRGVTRWVIESRQVFTAGAFDDSSGRPFRAADDERIPAGLAPLLVGDELLGLLVVDEPERLDRSFARMLYVLANLVALGIRNAQLFHRVEEAARRDSLTGLLHRGAFETACAALHETHAGRPWTLLLFDLDRFKSLNDVYGHQAGDAVLREAARLWQSLVPDETILARYGGEEFVAILPGCDLAAALEVAETLRDAVSRHRFRDDGRQLTVTASFGLADGIVGGESLDTLLRRADQLLYRAKAEGRNRIGTPGELVATR